MHVVTRLLYLEMIRVVCRVNDVARVDDRHMKKTTSLPNSDPSHVNSWHALIRLQAEAKHSIPLLIVCIKTRCYSCLTQYSV